MNETISIIVPVYNVEKDLPRCIDSIINQTYKNLEIILVDDGSPDNCGKICDEYAEKDKRIKVIHKENGGVSSSRNAGIDAAMGEYIAFVDSDDYIESDFCEKLLGLLKEHDVDLVSCGYNHIDKENKCINNSWVFQEKYIENKEKFFEDYIANKGYCCVVWGKIFKSEIIKNNKFKDLQLGEDTCFMFDVFFQTNNAYLTAYRGYNYIKQIESLSNSQNFNIGYCDRIKTVSYIKSLCKTYFPKYMKDINCCENRIILNVYDHLMIHGTKEQKKMYKQRLRDLSKQKIKEYCPIGLKRQLEVFIIKYAGFTVYDMLLKAKYKVKRIFKKE